MVKRIEINGGQIISWLLKWIDLLMGFINAISDSSSFLKWRNVKLMGAARQTILDHFSSDLLLWQVWWRLVACVYRVRHKGEALQLDWEIPCRITCIMIVNEYAARKTSNVVLDDTCDLYEKTFLETEQMGRNKLWKFKDWEAASWSNNLLSNR